VFKKKITVHQPPSSAGRRVTGGVRDGARWQPRWLQWLVAGSEAIARVIVWMIVLVVEVRHLLTVLGGGGLA
jgi:hypothetical protein